MLGGRTPTIPILERTSPLSTPFLFMLLQERIFYPLSFQTHPGMGGYPPRQNTSHSLPRPSRSGSLPFQPSPVLSCGRNLELITYD
jgi:hypothetical protein